MSPNILTQTFQKIYQYLFEQFIKHLYDQSGYLFASLDLTDLWAHKCKF